MIVADIKLPQACNKCIFLRGDDMYCPVSYRDVLDWSERPEWCGLKEVMPLVIRERVSHTAWSERTVYIEP